MKPEEFISDRDKALLSLDKDKIIAFMNKYNIAVPKDDLIFWAGVHKAILYMNSATEEQRDRSFTWILEHGLNPMVNPMVNPIVNILLKKIIRKK